MAEEGRLKHNLRVANFSYQSRDQRFPDPYRRYAYSNQTNIASYQPRVEETEEPDEPPRIAQWRLNLTALSQDLNLYFAAYRDKIHCYIPRDLRQTFRAKADLVLDLPRSELAEEIGGHILPQIPHCVNQIKVGELGDLEILLVATDDGDVIAYYTHLIWDEIHSLAKGARAILGKTSPFFHFNVRASTWGLAIHQKSRLIAVSSNRREITVFAFGYTDDGDCGFVPELKESCPRNCRRHRIMDTFPLASDITPPIVSMSDRKCNFRICIRLKQGSHNIPTIDFASDLEGVAVRVLAGDINGNMWVHDMFTHQFVRAPPILHNDIDSKRVWGVLCIPLEYFRLVKTPHDAFGISKLAPSLGPMEKLTGLQGQEGQFFDISSSVNSVESLSATSRAPELTLDEDQTVPTHFSDSNACGDWYENTPMVDRALAEQQAALDYLNTPPSRNPLARVRATESFRYWSSIIENNAYVPASTVPPKIDPLTEILRMQETEHKSFRHLLRLPLSLRSPIAEWSHIEPTYLDYIASLNAQIKSSGGKDIPVVQVKGAPRLIFLRCYAHDIEMLSPKNIMPFRTVLRRPVHRESPYLAPLLPVERLSLLALIPELNLLLVGSQNGRVCLLTLTKMEETQNLACGLLMFRLDLILPLKQHNFRIRPTCPLLGMAVSPLPRDVINSVFEPAQRRWRIILHYYDHTILSYDIFRESGGEALQIG